MADVEQQYVPRHLHTEYSLLDGAIRIGDLLNFCKENNFPELAYQTVLYELEQTETWGTLDTRLMVAKRDEPSELLQIN